MVMLDKMSDSVDETVTITNESVTIPAGINQTVTLANDDLTTFDQLLNASATENDSLYSVALSTGTITFIGNTSDGTSEVGTTYPAGDTAYAYYDYDKETAAESAITSTNDSLSDITNTWLAIIVVIMIMTVLIGILVSTFGNGMVGRR